MEMPAMLIQHSPRETVLYQVPVVNISGKSRNGYLSLSFDLRSLPSKLCRISLHEGRSRGVKRGFQKALLMSLIRK